MTISSVTGQRSASTVGTVARSEVGEANGRKAIDNKSGIVASKESLVLHQI